MNQDQIPTTKKFHSEFEKEPRATVNPYRFSAKLVYERLTWDLNWKSWISRHRLNRLYNSCAGQKAVILCTGPSLLGTDFDQLTAANIYSIGLNKINLLFDNTAFRPSCIVAMDRRVVEQNNEFYNETQIPLFLNSDANRHIRMRKNIIFTHATYAHSKFARNCSVSQTLGGTVTYSALQFAFHLGFSQVGLIGCDHDYSVRGVSGAEVLSGSSDPDHFHPDYFSKGDQWRVPFYRLMETHYELARTTYERNHRKIYNCTVGGNLEVFERWELSEFLQS